MRRLLAVATAVCTAIAGLVVLTGATGAASRELTRTMPGPFTGYGFDACQAPSQDEMDVWRERSPYWAVGIYISGENRYCDVQHNLSPEWVAEQARKGWRLLPLHVGRQAACTGVDRWDKISADPADNYAKARSQGRAEARAAVAAARSYGIGKRSTLWYDLEHFDITRRHCRESALSLVSAWTRKLHELGYRSGFYSSASSGIRMLDDSRRDRTDSYTVPDQIWLADWNGKPNTRTEFIPDDGWRQARVHQYRGGHDETYGGVTINIDSNFMDVGRGSVAPRPGRHCGVPVDFPTYRSLHRGQRHRHVAAGQCFLRQQGFYDGRIHQRFNAATQRAVRRFQSGHDLPVNGSLTKRTWTALTAWGGRTPLVKFGSAGHPVRRLQRSLNAAVGARLDITGVFTGPTRRAVRDYQRERGLHRTGVVTDDVWDDLRAGRR
jgi:peptidoglycan hydrolase-like protein with peptidoglycan-binding domain